MRTNPFNDTWLFLIGATPDHESSGIRYLLVVLFWALLIASFLIAWKNWRDDPEQRTGSHLATWFMRVMIGVMWFQGSLWKLPLPVSGTFRYWMEEMTQYAAFDAHKWLVENVFLPAIMVINPLVYLVEPTFATSFMLGLFVRPIAAIAILFVLHIWLGLYQHAHEWPWNYVFLAFVHGLLIVTNAGRSLGLDAWITRQPFGPFVGEGRIARLYRRLA